MSKLDDAIEILLSDEPEQSNAEIAARVGCDEGIVRRARKLVRVKVLEEENDRLKDELKQYRRAVRPRPKKHDPAEPLPLWERIGDDGEAAPAIPMLGEAP